ncbi:hypothetical protein [Streptomyces sp. NPDC057682]|uniref:hypothetical protein n=1 Tax=Streptomyces sp. NPDC057682 TaxID=3346210 RepID=UPI003693C6BF
MSIEIPKEQRRFANALLELAKEVGIEGDDWVESGPIYRQMEVYLTGRRISGDAFITDFMEIWEQLAKGTKRDYLATTQRLHRLAAAARAARAGAGEASSQGAG